MSEINFFWDPISDNILQERDAIGALTAEYTTEPGLYGNVISQNRGGVDSQFHFDALGSTLAVTDDNQQVTDTRAYSAFGETTESTGSTAIPFQYVGQRGYYRNGATGTYVVRRRAYDPNRIRWLSTDPLAVANHRLAAYHYVSNCPLVAIDRSGLLAQKVADYSDKFSEFGFSKNPFNGPCMSYLLATQWVLGDKEANGIISQRVINNESKSSSSCDKLTTDLALHLCKTPKCSNTIANCGDDYYELWRVKDGKIYMGDPLAANPTAEGGIDAFAHFGFDISTKGSHTKTGYAVFVPNDKLGEDVVAKLKELFGTGAKGVKGACDLTSACATEDTNPLWLKLLGLAGGEAAKVTKKASKRWDCCFPCACPDEKNRMTEFNYQLGTDAKVVFVDSIGRGEKPDDPKLLALWNRCKDCD